MYTDITTYARRGHKFLLRFRAAPRGLSTLPICQEVYANEHSIRIANKGWASELAETLMS